MGREAWELSLRWLRQIYCSAMWLARCFPVFNNEHVIFVSDTARDLSSVPVKVSLSRRINNVDLAPKDDDNVPLIVRTSSVEIW